MDQMLRVRVPDGGRIAVANAAWTTGETNGNESGDTKVVTRKWSKTNMNEKWCNESRESTVKDSG